MENKKYDLEKAKEDCRRHEDALEEAQSCMCGHCHECGFDPSEMKAALDEVERLRSFRGRIARILGQSPSDCDDLLIVGLDSRIILAKRLTARIKELESEITAWIADRDSWIGRYEAVRKEKDARIADQEAYIERLEAAFLEQFAQGIQAPKEKAELMAREALEKIKAETGSGDHVVGANQLILTAEQREAIRRLIEPIEILLVDHETDLDIEDAVRELRAMLKGYVPVWKATDERIAAMKDACNFLVYAEIRNKGVNPGNVDRAKNAGDVLRTMLEEGKRDA